MANLYAIFQVDWVEQPPGFVVIGPGCVCQAPVRHRTTAVVGYRLLKISVSLAMVEAIALYETAVEPDLRRLGRSADRPAVCAKIVIVVRGRARYDGRRIE